MEHFGNRGEDLFSKIKNDDKKWNCSIFIILYVLLVHIILYNMYYWGKYPVEVAPASFCEVQIRAAIWLARVPRALRTVSLNSSSFLGKRGSYEVVFVAYLCAQFQVDSVKMWHWEQKKSKKETRETKASQCERNEGEIQMSEERRSKTVSSVLKQVNITNVVDGR